jgi:hypothetical protein
LPVIFEKALACIPDSIEARIMRTIRAFAFFFSDMKAHTQ